MEKEIIAVIKKNVDVKGLAKDTLSMIVKPALDRVVSKSATKIDDIVLNLLYDRLAAEVVDMVDEKIKEVTGG